MSMPKLIKNGRFWPFWSIRAENDQKWTQKWSKKCPIFSSSTKIFWNPGTRDFFQNPCFARVHSVGNPGTGEKMSRSRFYYFIGALFFLAWHKNPGTRYWRALGYQEMSRCDTFFQKSWYWRKKKRAPISITRRELRSQAPPASEAIFAYLCSQLTLVPNLIFSLIVEYHRTLIR